MKRVAKFARGVVKDFFDDDAMSHAAAVAFYTSISFAPLVLLLMGVGGLLGENTKSELLGMFARQLGPRTEELAATVVETAEKGSDQASWWQTAFSTVGLFVAASAIFAQLQSSLNKMWGVVAKPAGKKVQRGRVMAFTVSVWGWLRKRLVSMGMVLVMLFILLVSLVISSLLGAVVPGEDGKEFGARALEFIVSVLIATLLFAAIYKVLPDARTTWRQSWLGGLVTAVLFNVGKLVLSLYIDRGGVGSDYGEGVGALIGLLIWVYYSCVAMLLGAEVTRRIAGAGAVRKEEGVVVPAASLHA